MNYAQSEEGEREREKERERERERGGGERESNIAFVGRRENRCRLGRLRQTVLLTCRLHGAEAYRSCPGRDGGKWCGVYDRGK